MLRGEVDDHCTDDERNDRVQDASEGDEYGGAVARWGGGGRGFRRGERSGMGEEEEKEEESK